MTVLDPATTGGIPVDVGGAAGGLVTAPGHLQYGEVRIPGWRELVNWRSLPDSTSSDSQRPQAHGAYPGDVFGQSLVVTYTYMLRGTPEDKLLQLATLEKYAPMDGVDRPLVVDDGDGAWLRQARVIARNVPQGKHFRHGPLECSVQFLCADPRRYALVDKLVTVGLPTSSGGLVYPLDYPLDYGTSTSGTTVASNDGGVDTPPVVKFYGPLTTPYLVSPSWMLGFDINLAAGETLTVDVSAGTALLNGSADRMYLITTDSDPVEACTLPPGDTTLALVSSAGSGHVDVAYQDARM